MGEKPILFSGPMVRAILDGRKTQTRRVVKPQPPECVQSFTWDDGCWWENGPEGFGPSSALRGKCPYGQPGSKLWVRETWQCIERFVDGSCHTRLPMRAMVDTGERELIYAATTPDGQHPPLWRPSIHMPRWASRITLEVVSVRVERVQEISWVDAVAEGMHDPRRSAVRVDAINPKSPLAQFHTLWDEINGGRGFGWEANPWVWVVEFKEVRRG